MSSEEFFESPAKLWRCGTEMRMNDKLNNLVLIEKELLWAVERINELHKRIVGPYDDYVCDHCTDLYGDSADVVPYPCPTIKALEGK